METDEAMLGRLRSGDESAFAVLVGRYHAPLLRLARTFTPSSAVAEEAVQDTWMAVVRGIDRFEGRSTVKTWLFGILVRRARTAGVREHRHDAVGDSEPAVPASRFDAEGVWSEPPEPWELGADDRLVAATWTATLREALAVLPPRQREVVLLRDVESLTSTEVCDVLDINEGTQRVLLHRGRSRLRGVLEAHLESKGR